MNIIRAADLFCGAGGTSTGMLMAADALGFRLDLVAVNHWPLAIQTHLANHPWARHICASLTAVEPTPGGALFEGGVDAVDPRKAVPGGKLDLLVASPECTHHSNARGGRPRSDQSRATPWCILRWADALRPEAVLIENVPEFRTWGPLDANGKPLKAEKGRTFDAFVNALDGLGYAVDWKVLCCANYGDATTRKRLFIQARRGRTAAVTWPRPTHSRTGAHGLPTWRAAREIIDWSLPGKSIFRRKKPLRPKTLKRIAAGLERFCGPWAEPFLVMLYGTGSARSIDRPLPTVTANGQHIGLAQPFIVAYHDGHDYERRYHDLDRPLPTLDTSNRFGLCEPFILATGHNEDPARRVRSIDEPLSTVVTKAEHCLVEPFVIGQQSCAAPRNVGEPLPTVAGKGAISLVEPYLVKYYGTGGARSVDIPLDTLTTKHRFGLVEPFVAEDADGNRYVLDILFRMLEPHELAAATGFPPAYRFCGNKGDAVKQIGNAVPAYTACALTGAAASAIMEAA